MEENYKNLEMDFNHVTTSVSMVFPNFNINQRKRKSCKVLGDGHVIGTSIDGCVFESIVTTYKNYIFKNNRVNEPITIYCFTLN